MAAAIVPIDYLPEHTLLVLDERRQAMAHGQQWFDHAEQHHGDEVMAWLPPTLHRPISDTIEALEAFAGFDLAELAETDQHPNSFDLNSRAVPAYPNQLASWHGLIKDFQREKTRVWLLSAQPSRAVALLEEHDRITRFVPNPGDQPAIERLIEQNTPVALKTKGHGRARGIAAAGLAFGADHRPGIFRPAKPHRERVCAPPPRGQPHSRSQPHATGDFVVHRNHGIGRFLKMEKLAISGDARDYLVVQYLDGLLRVAADQLGSLGRFRASSDAPPQLNKMGGAAWAKTKAPCPQSGAQGGL